MEDKTIEKVDFSIEELETNYYECTFDKCNFSDKPIGRVIFEKCTFKECNLSLVKTSNTSWLDVLFTDCKMTGINFSLSNRFGLSVEFHNCLLSYALFTQTLWKPTFPMQYLKIATFVMLLSIIPTWRKQISLLHAIML